jgi:hypothetical protein
VLRYNREKIDKQGLGAIEVVGVNHDVTNKILQQGCGW